MRFHIPYVVAAVLVAAAVGLVALVPVPVAAQEPVVHEVKLLFDDQGFRFEPAGILIQPGDTVRWIWVNGSPHSVTFYSGDGLSIAGLAERRRIPEGAPSVNSEIRNDGDTFEVVFDPAMFPQGTYDYFCIPHEALGMKGTIIVGAPGGPGSEINEEEPTPEAVLQGGGTASVPGHQHPVG